MTPLSLSHSTESILYFLLDECSCAEERKRAFEEERYEEQPERRDRKPSGGDEAFFLNRYAISIWISVSSLNILVPAIHVNKKYEDL